MLHVKICFGCQNLLQTYLTLFLHLIHTVLFHAVLEINESLFWLVKISKLEKLCGGLKIDIHCICHSSWLSIFHFVTNGLYLSFHLKARFRGQMRKTSVSLTSREISFSLTRRQILLFERNLEGRFYLCGRSVYKIQ